MRLGKIMLMQLSIKCRIRHCWFRCGVGGDAFITCPRSATWLATTALPHE